MAKQTLQARIIEALETLGCKRVEGKTSRYIVLTKMCDEGFYFVGKNGALRAGKNVTSSVSLQGWEAVAGSARRWRLVCRWQLYRKALASRD